MVIITIMKSSLHLFLKSTKFLRDVFGYNLHNAVQMCFCDDKDEDPQHEAYWGLSYAQVTLNITTIQPSGTHNRAIITVKIA